MELSHNECQSITSTLTVENFEEYLIARVTVTLDCCDDNKTFIEIPDITNTSPTDDVYVDSDNNFVINPSFFENGITNGVYTVVISLFQPNGTEFCDTGCLFVDCDLKCRVYEKVKTLTTDEEKTQILMKHYSLTVGSNCSCDCGDLCTIYKSLLEDLEGIEYDCGCL